MRFPCVFVLAVVLTGGVAAAHDSPDHEIEDLTAQMAAEGESAALLLRRASQYRVAHHPERAIADLQRVLQLEPDHATALAELCRIHLTANEPDRALGYVQRAIDSDRIPDAGKPHLYALRGDVHLARAEHEEAVADYDRAIAAEAQQLDWYFNRSRAQRQLGRHDDRIAGLRAGHATTQSAVLLHEWIDALIDGGQAEAALREIEPKLASARLKSSWLIRRARARLATSQEDVQAAAREDLRAAINEIDQRLHPTRPDGDLLIDRAQANLLLNDFEAARYDLEKAQAASALPLRLAELRSQLQKATSALPQ